MESNGEESKEKAKSKSPSVRLTDLVKKNTPLFFGLLVILIIAFLWIFLVFLPSQYKFSFNINGVDFVSNEYMPSEFFREFKDNNSILVFVEAPNNAVDAWVANSMNLWLIALNADKKQAVLVIKNIDSSGKTLGCLTNDGNVLVSREMTVEECNLVENDFARAKIFIKLGSTNTVILSKNKLISIASGTKTISNVNYYAIKEMYADFDDVLAKVNERINSIN
jgi:hypothetical protein